MRWLIVFLLLVMQPEAPRFVETLRIERGTDENMWIVFGWEYFDFNQDGSQIAAAAADKTVTVWDTESGEVVSTFTGLPENVHAAVYSPDYEWLAGGAYPMSSLQSDEVKIWNVETGEVQQTLISAYGLPFAWSPDSTKIATIGGTLNITDVMTGEVLVEGEPWGDIVNQLLWTPDGTKILSVSTHDAIYGHIWNTNGELIDHFWGLNFIALSPDGSLLATQHQIRDLETGLPVTVIPELKNYMVWHPTENWIANFGFEPAPTVRIWNTVTGERVVQWSVDGCYQLTGLAWSNDGQKLGIGCFQLEPTPKYLLTIWERQ